MSRETTDYTGQFFGRAVVLRKTDERSSANGVVWVLKCGCGDEFKRDTNALGVARKLGRAMGCDACVKLYRGALARRRTTAAMHRQVDRRTKRAP